jgi:hypothetical protein
VNGSLFDLPEEGKKKSNVVKLVVNNQNTNTEPPSILSIFNNLLKSLHEKEIWEFRSDFEAIKALQVLKDLLGDEDDGTKINKEAVWKAIESALPQLKVKKTKERNV